MANKFPGCKNCEFFNEAALYKKCHMCTQIQTKTKTSGPTNFRLNLVRASQAKMPTKIVVQCRNCGEDIPIDKTGDHTCRTGVNAKDLTFERGKEYGHPLDAFRRIASAREVLSECPDPEVRHALEMIWVKICRLIEKPDHTDSIDDIAGYAETIRMLHAERKQRALPVLKSGGITEGSVVLGVEELKEMDDTLDKGLLKECATCQHLGHSLSEHPCSICIKRPIPLMRELKEMEDTLVKGLLKECVTCCYLGHSLSEHPCNACTRKPIYPTEVHDSKDTDKWEAPTVSKDTDKWEAPTVSKEPT